MVFLLSWMPAHTPGIVQFCLPSDCQRMGQVSDPQLKTWLQVSNNAKRNFALKNNQPLPSMVWHYWVLFSLYQAATKCEKLKKQVLASLSEKKQTNSLTQASGFRKSLQLIFECFSLIYNHEDTLTGLKENTHQIPMWVPSWITMHATYYWEIVFTHHWSIFGIRIILQEIFWLEGIKLFILGYTQVEWVCRLGMWDLWAQAPRG